VARNRQTGNKRQREAAKREKKRRKAERRAQRQAEKQGDAVEGDADLPMEGEPTSDSESGTATAVPRGERAYPSGG
jgi:hypothetical protein